ncbi:MAG: hypothetical protein RL088_1067 [Verrucomicrobiota bacterium]|jgi:hypothetical protein
MDWVHDLIASGNTTPLQREALSLVPDNGSGEISTIRQLLAEQITVNTKKRSSFRCEESVVIKRVLELDTESRSRVVDALSIWLQALEVRAACCLEWLGHKPFIRHEEWDHHWSMCHVCVDALEILLGTELELHGQTVLRLVKWYTEEKSECSGWLSVIPLVEWLYRVCPKPVPENWTSVLISFEQILSVLSDRNRDLLIHSKRLLDMMELPPRIRLDDGEAWSDCAMSDIRKSSPAILTIWAEFIESCRWADAASPSAKWKKTAVAAVDSIGEKDFAQCVSRWFPLTNQPRTVHVLSEREWASRCAVEELRRLNEGRLHLPYESWYEIVKEVTGAERPWDELIHFPLLESVRSAFGANPPNVELPPAPPPYDAPEDKLISEPNMNILRGLAWACGLFPSPELARALTTLALSAYRKVPGKGPRAVRVGNACITGLAMMGGLDAVGQLAVLKVKVKFGTAQIAIEKALKACAEKSGIPRDELEEMSVPAYGLTEVGSLVEPLGECSAELRIVDSREVALIFRGADGKERKALPAAVKEQFREELKELSAAKKDIEKMLPAQAERLDALFLAQKTWAIEAWLERYAEHPLVGALARRLIWNFSTGGITTAGVWFDGKFVDRSGVPVPLDASQTRVSLWHPLGEPADTVLAWRVFLEERRIRQPFKQAHREIYLLTPAEAATVTYSNRFAAHLLRQHQFNSLCATRGWKNKLRLMVDDSYPPPTRRLPQWGLRAEFWIESAGDDFGTDTNESGVYLHVATDQVRFYPLEAAQVSTHASGGGYTPGWQETAAEPLRLVDVPAMVFSEIMRDVDLFVGVASVGNDPAWADGGRREAERGAWGHFAFGDLSATAKTRRDVLERLVPKLKIAALCSFEEKFLVVRGKLRTYKIHLGSGNILMSPNDQYLCIVPSRGKADSTGLFLPFEGDGVLSLIISKALLLAADDKITDPSITRQIRA